MIKKILAVSLLFGFCGLTYIAAQEQNLAELARKEKERREALKSKQAKVITNKDLENLQKTPALIIKGQEATTSEGTPPAGSAQTPSSPSVVHRVTVENPPASQSTYSSPAGVAGQSSSVDTMSSSLETSWKKAQEYVELLTLKMNALWQQFYNTPEMSTRDNIQQQISETYEKLIKAQEEETRLRAEYEKQLNQKKSEGASPIWIK